MLNVTPSPFSLVLEPLAIGEHFYEPFKLVTLMFCLCSAGTAACCKDYRSGEFVPPIEEWRGIDMLLLAKLVGIDCTPLTGQA